IDTSVSSAAGSAPVVSAASASGGAVVYAAASDGAADCAIAAAGATSAVEINNMLTSRSGLVMAVTP
ncbi:MAG: hypothetical protein ACTHJU_00865, partial [Sphingopyxis sp.]